MLFSRKQNWSAWILVALLGIILLRILLRAWVSEDAFITLRVVDNFVNGFGLRWNILERVQVFTHPLWLFLLTPFYFFTHEPFFTTIFVSIITTFASVWLLVFKIAKTKIAAIFALLPLIFSSAFLDFSTSGLENPLTHLLLAAFIFIFIQKSSSRQIFLLALFAALAGLNRLDAILFFLPALAFVFFTSPKKFQSCGIILLGLLPLFFWEIFSIVYFGFPFPNTAYAKLATGVSSLDLLRQGGRYFLDSFIRDPIMLPTVLAGSVFAFTARNKKFLAIVFGMLFYALYILKIGGDFMSGRFFTPLLFVAVALLSQILNSAQLKKFAVLIAIFAALGFGIHFSGSRISNETLNSFGISDERKFFESENSIAGVIRLGGIENHSWGVKKQGSCDDIELFWNVGIFGYFSPRDCFIVDGYALTDAFLARISANQNWRIGHFDRDPPEGYLESLSANQNLLVDPDLKNLA
ncbi:hypothetical protein K9N08_01690 [Candidatus Gracilibacteria bacterium]|nr:hypothetical protein [Candidatus Gracilibacteria bacterium]MCF7856250.1 hypothetical protein [Candidatus Gracilibacteria bacterium]MCF7896684.1 hypothetical protein [Candidatus Gracilibacteria bacterium]